MTQLFDRLLIFTGAGISQESGIPTFRGENGIWLEHNVGEVCSYSGFKANKQNAYYRKKLFDFYNQARSVAEAACPNEAHLEIARWQNTYGTDKVLVFTSNVDTLLEKAGCKQVTHVHGVLTHQHCDACQHRWEVNVFEDVRCPHCTSRLTKPDVVFFGERAPSYLKLDSAFHPKRRTSKDILVYAGSSQSVIAPDRLFGRPGAKKGTKILANLTKGPQDSLFDLAYYLPATKAFKEISSKQGI